MSPSWASRLGWNIGTRRALGFALGAGLASSLALAGAAGAHAHAAAARDSATNSFEADGDGMRIATCARDLGRIDLRLDPRRGHHRARLRHLLELGDSTGDSSRNSGGIVVDTDQAGLVRVFADAEVPRGERMFGSVAVGGTVSGNVVAVFGSVKLAPGATVDGDVVAIGGALQQAKDATVGGESVSLGFLPFEWGMPGLSVLLLSVFTGWLLSIFVGWLVTVLFPDRMLRVAVTASRRGVASFFLGLVSLPLMLFSVMLLSITVIGIPVAMLLALLYPFMVWAGQIASTFVLGSRLLHRRLGQGGAMMPILAGTLFVAMFFVVGAVLASPPGIARTVALCLSLLAPHAASIPGLPSGAAASPPAAGS